MNSSVIFVESSSQHRSRLFYCVLFSASKSAENFFEFSALRFPK
ncbi:hypothetical protein NIES2104_01000 [Leptolyngbya sp. NIES-2104]|nr:hypothetical protein NIES2104_01000 [Leptolyngbya sp. NIES-2104]